MTIDQVVCFSSTRPTHIDDSTGDLKTATKKQQNNLSLRLNLNTNLRTDIKVVGGLRAEMKSQEEPSLMRTRNTMSGDDPETSLPCKYEES